MVTRPSAAQRSPALHLSFGRDLQSRPSTLRMWLLVSISPADPRSGPRGARDDEATPDPDRGRRFSFADREEGSLMPAKVRWRNAARKRTKLDARVGCVTSNVNANTRGRSRTTAHDRGGLNISGHQGDVGNFLRMRSHSEASRPRLVCQYREQIPQAFAAVHQRLIQPLFNERGRRLPKCLRLLALPRGRRQLSKHKHLADDLETSSSIETQSVSEGKVRTSAAFRLPGPLAVGRVWTSSEMRCVDAQTSHRHLPNNRSLERIGEGNASFLFIIWGARHAAILLRIARCLRHADKVPARF